MVLGHWGLATIKLPAVFTVDQLLQFPRCIIALLTEKINIVTSNTGSPHSVGTTLANTDLKRLQKAIISCFFGDVLWEESVNYTCKMNCISIFSWIHYSNLHGSHWLIWTTNSNVQLNTHTYFLLANTQICFFCLNQVMKSKLSDKIWYIDWMGNI